MGEGPAVTDLRLPCREGNEDDWFIRADGRQYRDDDLLTSEERNQIAALLTYEIDPEDHWNEYVDAVDRAIDRAEAAARVLALQRRRHAKEACHDCLFRTRCLQIAIDGDEQHGTWGGYYEEELGEIRKEIRRRNRRRVKTAD